MRLWRGGVGVIRAPLTEEEAEPVRDLVLRVGHPRSKGGVARLAGLVAGGAAVLVQRTGVGAVHEEQFNLAGLAGSGSDLSRPKL